MLVDVFPSMWPDTQLPSVLNLVWFMSEMVCIRLTVLVVRRMAIRSVIPIARFTQVAAARYVENKGWKSIADLSSNMVGVEILLSESSWKYWAIWADFSSHCGTGCISGCLPSTPATPTPTSSAFPRADGQCGAVSLEPPFQQSHADTTSNSVAQPAMQQVHMEVAAPSTGG